MTFSDRILLLQQIMDWQGLQILNKIPKKKYIKKLLEYAFGISQAPLAVPFHFNTPISQQYPGDLQLTSEDSHRVILALIGLIQMARESSYNEQKMRQTCLAHLQQKLLDNLMDGLSKLKEDAMKIDNGRVSHADKLMSFNWQIDVEIASDMGNTNIPIVQLQLTTASNHQIKTIPIQLKAPEFSVFFKNLQKIKEQLSQLASHQ